MAEKDTASTLGNLKWFGPDKFLKLSFLFDTVKII